MKELINVVQENGKLIVGSREVSLNFEKRHGHVIEKIDGIIEGINSTEKSVQYFIPHEYKDLSGKLNKEYLLTRDGFSLLVMGFTGNKALDWKMKYIQAKGYFNITSYHNTLKKDFQIALNLIRKWTPTGELLRLIQMSNNQLAFSEVGATKED